MESSNDIQKYSYFDENRHSNWSINFHIVPKLTKMDTAQKGIKKQIQEGHLPLSRH